MSDKYTAYWVSHSSISDFLKCPRAYFLKNVYKDPKSGKKIKLMSPPLALGKAVHEVIESLSILPVEKRFEEPLMVKLEISWKKVSGKKGGFSSIDEEEKYKERGRTMIRQVTENPGPLSRRAVKIKGELPYFWLSEEDNIILCGKIDWLEYLPEEDAINIVDFKTGKGKEDPKSLQLPIYHLLANYCQTRAVKKASYWYLEKSDVLEEKPLPDLGKSMDKILKIAKDIKLAKQLERFKCLSDGCSVCEPLEVVLRGGAEFVGVDEIGRDTYVLAKFPEGSKEAEIL